MKLNTVFAAGFFFFAFASVNAKVPVDQEIKAAAIRGANFCIESSVHVMETFELGQKQALIDFCEQKLSKLRASANSHRVDAQRAECEFYRSLGGSELEQEIKQHRIQIRLVHESYKKALRMIENDNYDPVRMAFFVRQDQARVYSYAAASRIVHEAMDECAELLLLLKNDLPAAHQKLFQGNVGLLADHFDLEPINRDVVSAVLAEDEEGIHELCRLIESYQAPLNQMLNCIEVENYLKFGKLKTILSLAKHYQIPLTLDNEKTVATIKIETDLKKAHRFKTDGKDLLIRLLDRFISLLSSTLEEISKTSDEDFSDTMHRIRPERIAAALQPISEEMFEAYARPVPILSLRKARIIKEGYIVLFSEKLAMFNELKNGFMPPQVQETTKEILDSILSSWNMIHPAEPVHLVDLLNI